MPVCVWLKRGEGNEEEMQVWRHQVFLQRQCDLRVMYTCVDVRDASCVCVCVCVFLHVSVFMRVVRVVSAFFFLATKTLFHS